MKINIILICLLSFVSIVNAETGISNDETMLNKKSIALTQPTSLDDLEAEESIENLKKQLSLVNKIPDSNYTQCSRAFGHEKFCRCLTDNLPLVLTFVDYVKVMQIRISTDKEFMDLSENIKEMIRKARKARDMCVRLF